LPSGELFSVENAFLITISKVSTGMIIAKCHLIEEIYAMPETQPAFP